MCGIVGAFSCKNICDLMPVVTKMNELQVHRGPDGSGIFASPKQNLIFGHRRLSIIDLSEHGVQPMTSSNNRFTITYNGEIYNYEELKQKCIQKGSVFHSKTDTEVIMEYIAHYGIEGIRNFRGMWAFVLYDSEKNKVIMSRDPFGIKPFHYGIHNDVLYFASEIKSLRCTNPYFNVPDEATKKLFIDSGALDIGLWTFFKNVKRFPAACYSEIALDKEINLEFIEYWTPPKQIQNIKEQDAIIELDRLFKQSIQRHLISDVPVAFCLSGGLDSSSIVGVSAALVDNTQSLTTFTTRYPNYSDIDESKWAKIVADACKTKTCWVEPTHHDFDQEFDKVLYYHDEPFGSCSIYAQNAIFKAINQSNIKVSLDGQGADEILAGYHSFYIIFLFFLLKEKKYILFIKEFCALLFLQPRSGLNIIKNHLIIKLKHGIINQKCTALKNKLIKIIKHKANGTMFILVNSLQKILSPERNKIVIAEINTETSAAAKINAEAASTRVKINTEAGEPSVNNEIQNRLLYKNKPAKNFHEHLINCLLIHSIPSLLRNGDRNSMKSSVESRVPFLDVDLVNFVMSLPDSFKIRRAVTKYIMRLVAVKYLPYKVVYRKDKLGFPSPEKDWLKKSFDIDVGGSFTLEFRKLIVERWEYMINNE